MGMYIFMKLNTIHTGISISYKNNQMNFISFVVLRCAYLPSNRILEKYVFVTKNNLRTKEFNNQRPVTFLLIKNSNN